MKTYIKLEKNNGTTFYGFQFSKGNLVFLGKLKTVSNFLEEELFTVDVGSIFNKNWYTYIEHNFDITISLYIPKAFHQENILISYLPLLALW